MRLDLGMTPTTFLSEYWQKKPLLVRGALPGIESPVDPDQLAGLACEDEIESRLIIGPDDEGNWQLEHGPFQESRFDNIGDSGWSLLIQDTDKLLESVDPLVQCFRFLPDWRIDDVMISFAAPGGSVGPHWDHYDVFLIQAQGRRRWQVDARSDPDLELRPDQDLKLLARFNPDQEWELQPGDLLYLPPGIPHHGIAMDACVTCSLGMRAPSHEELIIDFAETIARGLTENDRYTDTDLAPSTDAGEIDESTAVRILDIIRSRLELDDSAFRRWLGAFLTRYRLPYEDAAPPQETQSIEGPLMRNPWSRFAWTRDGDQALLFVSGNSYPATQATASLLCRETRFDVHRLSALSANDLDRDALAGLVSAGHLVACDD